MADQGPRASACLGLLVVGTLLAGCLDPGGGASGPVTSMTGTQGPLDIADNTTAPPALPVTLELQGCLQLHTYFPYPVAVFSQLGFELPSGFTFASDDGVTVEAFLAWWFCPTGALNNSVNAPFDGVASMFASLPVVPPSDLAALDPRSGEVQLDLVLLTWIVSQRVASEHLGRMEGLRGGYVEFGEVRQTTTADFGGATIYGATAPTSFGVFDVDATIQAAPGTNPEGRYRMWLSPDSGEVTSYLDIWNSAGATLGSGAADLRFAGDAESGAPPATLGTSHVVATTDVVVSLVDLA